MENKNQHAVVIGGSSGIGLATATALHQRGYAVTITGRNEEKLRDAVKALDTAVGTAAFDGGKPGEVRRFFDGLGAFDHLVLCLSGGRGLGPFATLDLAEVRAGVDEKIWPQLSCAQAALPTISRNGSITFVSAVSAQLAAPGIAGIAAINGMLLSVTPILAAELKPLRINTVAPGVIDTPWWDFLPAHQRQAVFSEYGAKTPVGRVGRPEEVAEAITSLVKNGFITGQVLTVDGGLRYAA
ncbi:MAG: SDR family oxidoreductase [Rhizobiaceae bacterium]|nr:MAG: SDR family oxidoreductase [Rhizobiaceae bacterium]